ncbi:uncharacterized protein FA14DRAFT_185500 [Meira miltonrushii]|uniref:Ribosomal RNA-processing protein 36 n=1 Tax=Meira miltonrushii TaxID=1280837 RepID=A0A316VD39_9BASI|nr:uncharacterized protein FA14DRAFT_185500 [Meira miltonrushii]PWN34153.1 hypothetical protein FA14DRAFT_185500 [Meira miltonrushii]
MLPRYFLSVLLLCLSSQCIPYGSEPSSPASSEWKEFLNSSPEQIHPAHSEATHEAHHKLPPPAISQSQPAGKQEKKLSQRANAVNSRKHREKMKRENLEDYKEKTRLSSRRSYKTRMQRIRSDPKSYEDHLAAERERSIKYRYKAKAELIEDPVKREEFLRKAKDDANAKARVKYQLRKLFTGQPGKSQHQLRKDRIKAGTATQEDHEKVKKELERRRNWARQKLKDQQKSG